MKTVAFLSDFGDQDGYPAIIQAVIQSISPRTPFITITNEIEHQNILSATLVLQRCLPYFAKQTIFLAIVDPGVGTPRKCIAASIGPDFFVGPDNGLISPLVDYAQLKGWKIRYYDLREPRYWLLPVSVTFHGRDIFAPVAAHISRGIPLHRLGPRVEHITLFKIPLPTIGKENISGQIIAIDHFGNIISNIKKDMISNFVIQAIKYKKSRFKTITTTFGEGFIGQPFVYFDSDGAVSIAIRDQNASLQLHAKIGDEIEILISSKE